MKETYIRYWLSNRLVWAVLLLLLASLTAFYFVHGQIETHLLLNGFHHPVLDGFFKYYTYVGGGFPCYVGLALLLYRVRPGLFILASQATASILTQIGKYGFAHPRPLTLFNQLGLQLPETVEGVRLWDAFNSFPSGHTSAIFAFFFCLIALLPAKGRGWQWALLLLAVAGAYSRIYLSQHFLEDTLLGAFIGALAAALMYGLFYYKQWGAMPLHRIRPQRNREQ